MCWVRGSVAGAVSVWKFVINCVQAREAFCFYKKPDRVLYQCWSYNKQSDLVQSIEHVSCSCHLWKPAVSECAGWRSASSVVALYWGDRICWLDRRVEGDYWQEGNGGQREQDGFASNIIQRTDCIDVQRSVAEECMACLWTDKYVKNSHSVATLTAVQLTV